MGRPVAIVGIQVLVGRAHVSNEDLEFSLLEEGGQLLSI